MIFFLQQKTAYQIMGGDWSSDVCSSNLMTVRVVKHKKTKKRNIRNWNSRPVLIIITLLQACGRDHRQEYIFTFDYIYKYFWLVWVNVVQRVRRSTAPPVSVLVLSHQQLEPMLQASVHKHETAPSLQLQAQNTNPAGSCERAQTGKWPAVWQA